MNEGRVDTLARMAAKSGGRREALRLLAGALLAGAGGVSGGRAARGRSPLLRPRQALPLRPPMLFAQLPIRLVPLVRQQKGVLTMLPVWFSFRSAGPAIDTSTPGMRAMTTPGRVAGGLRAFLHGRRSGREAAGSQQAAIPPTPPRGHPAPVPEGTRRQGPAGAPPAPLVQAVLDATAEEAARVLGRGSAAGPARLVAARDAADLLRRGPRVLDYVPELAVNAAWAETRPRPRGGAGGASQVPSGLDTWRDRPATPTAGRAVPDQVA